MSLKKMLLYNLFAVLIFAVSVSLTVVFSRPPEIPQAPATIQEASDESWAFFLINEKNPLPENYEPELMLVTEDFFLDARCAEYARNMLTAAENDGVILNVVSAYRSRQRQSENFDNYVARLMYEGMSEADAILFTAAQIAKPGASEHNAGLALDILSTDWFDYNNDITDEFDRTPEFRWLAANSWKYGFILRYPKGKEEITGIIYEPWHFRYVGIDVAEQIFNSGFTLDEYIELYPPTRLT